MVSLTPAQNSVYRFIEARLKSGQSAPTVREICSNMSYRSTRSAQDVLSSLIRKGWLAREPGCARSLRLLHTAEPKESKTDNTIPLLGSIVAGIPEAATEVIGEKVPFPPTFFGIPKTHRAFALRVYGDSMIGRFLLSGDIVVCDADAEPRDGDLVAAVIDQESTLKTLVQRKGTVWLHAENPAYPELYPAAELTIQGVVCGVIRSNAA